MTITSRDRIENLENTVAALVDGLDQAFQCIQNFTLFVGQSQMIMGALLENKSPSVLRSILDSRYNELISRLPGQNIDELNFDRILSELRGMQEAASDLGSDDQDDSIIFSPR